MTISRAIVRACTKPGLLNLGNTCFMGALQAIIHTPLHSQAQREGLAATGKYGKSLYTLSPKWSGKFFYVRPEKHHALLVSNDESEKWLGYQKGSQQDPAESHGDGSRQSHAGIHRGGDHHGACNHPLGHTVIADEKDFLLNLAMPPADVPVFDAKGELTIHG